MNPRDILKRLPSVNELLENPQVKAVVDRVPVREVSTRARAFLDRVYREVERRSADISIPSIGELADRAARFLLTEHESQPHVAINATGQLWGDNLPSPPLSAEAVQRIARLADGYWELEAGRSDVQRRLAKLAGAEAALVTDSHAAALAVAFSAIGEAGAAIARGDVGTLAGGARVADIAKLAGCPLREVGASDRVTLADFEQQTAMVGGVALISLQHGELSPRSVGVEIGEVAATVHAKNGILIHDLGVAPPGPIEAIAELQITSAAGALAAGVDLVVVRGDGWLGGPPCGILLGGRTIIDELTERTLTRMSLAGSTNLAALAGTLDSHEPTEQARVRVPILALATAPIENLRTRAERLAPQIEACEEIASAEIVEIPADTTARSMPARATIGIDVVPHNASRAVVRDRLAQSSPKLCAAETDLGWRLDLQSVLASQDLALAAAFRKLPSDEAEQPDEQSQRDALAE